MGSPIHKVAPSLSASFSQIPQPPYRHLCAEIRLEMDNLLTAEDDPAKMAKLIPMESIMEIVHRVVPFYMSHNSEPEACDLLLEVDHLDLIEKYCEKHNHRRVCEYLRSCASYHPFPEDEEIYKICFHLYLKYESFYDAMRFALKLDDTEMVNKVMDTVSGDKTMTRQLGYASLPLPSPFNLTQPLPPLLKKVSFGMASIWMGRKRRRRIGG